MPAAPFAALEARVNAAVFARLANVVVQLGGVQRSGIFDNGHTVASVAGLGMASRGPVLQLLTAEVPPTPEGRQIVVQGRAYTVVEHQPDGTGISTLMLEVAA